MNIIYDKIRQTGIDDSKIIQDIEHAKETPGFDINLGHNKDNLSLLMTAVYHGRKELVRYLLSFPGINVNHSTYYESIALYYCNEVSILKLLLSRKELDVNIQSTCLGYEWTGLLEFCYHGREACVRELLLDARVDAFIRDIDGVMAQDVALNVGCPGIAKIINNSRYTSLLRIPNKMLLYDIVRMIIEEYVRIIKKKYH